MDFEDMQQSHTILQLLETPIQDEKGYNPMRDDFFWRIIEGVQQHFPHHTSGVIMKYYSYIVTFGKLEFPGSESENDMIQNICELIRKIQKELLDE